MKALTFFTIRRTAFVITLAFGLLLEQHQSNAQAVKKYSSKNFGINEGLLSGQVEDVTEDGNGFLWVSSGVGLQRFDGTNFETISPRKGLPQTDHLSLFKLKDGNIWLTCQSGISEYNATTNKFSFIVNPITNHPSHKPSGEENISGNAFIKPLLELNSRIWCWDDREKLFIAINRNSGKIEDSFHLPAGFYSSAFNAGRYKIAGACRIFMDAYEIKAPFQVILDIDFKSKEAVKIFRSFPGSRINSFVPVDESGLLFTTDSAAYCLDYSTGRMQWSVPYPALISGKHIYTSSAISLSPGNIALVTNNELFIVNTIEKKISYRMVNQRNEPFSNPGYINNCFTDRFRHLWLISSNEGLKKIDYNDPDIRYYGYGKIENNFNRCIYADKKSNLVITGTLFNGIDVFDTSQHLLKHFSLHTQEQTSCIMKLDNYRYMVFTDGKPGVYILNAHDMSLAVAGKQLLNGYKPGNITYYTYLQPLTPTTSALFCDYKIYTITNKNGNINFLYKKVNLAYSSAVIDDKGRVWLGTTGKYFLLTGDSLNEVKEYSLPEKVMTKCALQDHNHNIWLGTARGLYKINNETGKIVRLIDKNDGLANDCIYSLTEDSGQNLWMATNRGISGLMRDGSILNIYANDGLQGDEFNTNSVAKDESGELFFGGVNGVNSFYPGKMKNLRDKPHTLLTGIKVMDTDWNPDTSFWNIKQIDLPYTKNVVAFNFTAMGRYSPEIYSYRYRMKGIDESWVSAGNHGYARYVLPPGNYEFEYSAATEPGRNETYHSLMVVIRPPFWKTLWFRVCSGVTLLLIVFTSFRYYTKLRSRRQLAQIHLQQKISLERQRISRDLHDNIGAYATVLMASTEKLKSQQTEPGLQHSVEMVSENAKNIIGALHETIWVLNKEIITVTEFIDRFKEYARKILKNYHDIEVSYVEEIDNDVQLLPEEALHVFRIMQEALQNALKHAHPSRIIITVKSADILYISLIDNGNGFNTSEYSAGYGLSNMKQRAREAGYEVELVSGTGGTELRLTGIRKINDQNRSFAV